ncbi:uncharacterized protein V6R79_022771 [Siganus canaliculatus]
MVTKCFDGDTQCQTQVFGEKQTGSSRGCTLSRRRCFFILLLLGTAFFFYTMGIETMTFDWRQYNSTKLWPSFKNEKQHVVYPKMTYPSARATESSSPENVASTTVAHMTSSTSSTAAAVTQQRTVPPTPLPYKSPGPYLVEYPYKYHFVIDEPKTCEEQKPFVVLLVPVAPFNRAHRDIVRSTWGGDSLVLGKVVKLFFLLGLHAGDGAQQLQEQLLQESREHQDLIQSDFLDCYKNLTIKTMVMLEWLDSRCSSASYAMKIDSDMFLNVPNLVQMLLNAPKTNYMTGLVAHGGAVLRDPNSKWYVPVDVYPHQQYPRYALGLGYVLSLDLPKKLLEASRHVAALYIEDVYLGLCMQHLGISPTDPPNWGYFQVFPVTYSRCAYSKLIATTTSEHSNRVRDWNDFKKPGIYC